MAEVNQALADQFLLSVSLQSELKKTEMEKQRAMELGLSMKTVAEGLFSQKVELETHAAQLAGQAAAASSAAAAAQDKVLHAEHATAVTISEKVQLEQRAEAAEKKLTEFETAVRQETPTVMAERQELSELRVRVG